MINCLTYWLLEKINPLYIRIIINMYLNKKLKFSYNGATSRCFSVSNGLNQGGMLSPTLLWVYVDGMLEKLKESWYGSKYCGGVGFADYLFLLTPSSICLEKQIVDICVVYTDQFDITFNGHNSQVIVFGMKVVDIMPDIY